MTSDVGQQIKYYRERKEMTLKDLAKHSGLSISYLSYIETGKKQPTRDALEKIASGLNVSIAELTKEERTESDYSWFLELPKYIQDFLRSPESIPYLHVTTIAFRCGISAREMMKWVLPVDHMPLPGNKDTAFGRTFEIMFNALKNDILSEDE